MDQLLQLVGRFHVLLVHFPLALLVTAALAEAFGIIRRRTTPAPASGTCLLIGALAGIVTATTGWFHADYTPFPDQLSTLFYHRWLGIAAAALAVVVLALHRAARNNSTRMLRIYQAAAIASALLVSVTAHFGGTLTHGPDYLFGSLATSQPTTQAASFGYDKVAPILARSCIQCHGPINHKANLRLDTIDAMLTGGNGGPAIVPGDSEHSLLIRRCLGLDNRPRMPYKRPALPDDQIAQMRQWIDAMPAHPAATSQPR